jgi:hypothetical protein
MLIVISHWKNTLNLLLIDDFYIDAFHAVFRLDNMEVHCRYLNNFLLELSIGISSWALYVSHLISPE